jgi:3-oxoacyl-[acyl-carrier-protein] synthase-3
MDGMSVFNFAITEVPKIISESLVDTKNYPDGIDLFALHQANQLIIRQISKKLKIDNAKMPFIASTVGNTGPASIPLLLSMGFANDASKLHKVLMCGFGVGLNWGVSICDLTKTQIYSPVSA